MFAQKLQRNRLPLPFRLLAFGGALFIKVLGHHDCDQHAGPIRNGIAKK
jgi:hypothetical protein